jgi:hypothetical protein
MLWIFIICTFLQIQFISVINQKIFELNELKLIEQRFNLRPLKFFVLFWQNYTFFFDIVGKNPLFKINKYVKLEKNKNYRILEVALFSIDLKGCSPSSHGIYKIIK